MKSWIPCPRGPPPAMACAANSSALKGEPYMTDSLFLRDRRWRDGLEMRQGFDAAQPRKHRGVGADLNPAFGRMRHIRVAGKIRDGRMLRCEEIPVSQMIVHEAQENGGDLLRT